MGAGAGDAAPGALLAGRGPGGGDGGGGRLVGGRRGIVKPVVRRNVGLSHCLRERAEGEIRIIIRCVRCLGPVEADALVPSTP